MAVDCFEAEFPPVADGVAFPLFAAIGVGTPVVVAALAGVTPAAVAEPGVGDWLLASDLHFRFGAAFFFVPSLPSPLSSDLPFCEPAFVLELPDAFDFPPFDDFEDLDVVVDVVFVLDVGGGAIPNKASSSNTDPLLPRSFESFTRFACRLPSFCITIFCNVSNVRTSFRTESYKSHTRFVGIGVGDTLSSANVWSILFSKVLFKPADPPVAGGTKRPD